MVSGATMPAKLAPLAPYVQESAHGYSLAAVPASVVAEVGKSRIDALQKYWGAINPVIATDTTTVRTAAATTATVTPATTYRGPHGYVKTHWWGLEVGLDKYAVDKLTGGGASVAGICALLGVPAAVAVVILVAVAILKICQKSSGWSYVYQVLGVWGCNPF